MSDSRARSGVLRRVHRRGRRKMRSILRIVAMGMSIHTTLLLLHCSHRNHGENLVDDNDRGTRCHRPCILSINLEAIEVVSGILSVLPIRIHGVMVMVIIIGQKDMAIDTA